jgi:hypothetical protein
VTFIDRTYPDVVRDILTGLTQGVTGEVHRIDDYDPKAKPVQVPDVVLKLRPVRRVSFVSGFVAAAKDGDPPVPFTFTPADYDLVGDPAAPTDRYRLRFLPFGSRPLPQSDLTVNYYPRTTDPAPINDLNVGSVARTLVEALARELSLLWKQLDLAYDSAFLETASGPSLDRVAALLSYRRFRAGRPVGTVTFDRRAGLAGNITIPAGTPVGDAAAKVLYETAESHDMLAGESTAQVRVRGASESTPPVEAGVLTVVQRAIAGLESVTNERPTTSASGDESDEELRARVGAALVASDTGTVEAIVHGLLQLPEVRDARVIEMPNGVPGEIRVLVSFDPGAASGGKLPAAGAGIDAAAAGLSPAVRAVLARLDQLRPAGVRVLTETAATVALAARLELVLAGSQLPPAEIERVHAAARDTLIAEVGKKGVGETIRNRPLVAALLADRRLVDVTLTLAAKDNAVGTAGADFAPPAGALVELAPADVAFAADRFEKTPGGPAPVTVAVQAKLAATPQTGIGAAQVQALLTAKLKAFFAALAPGAAVDAPALLTALRDDANYALDPLKLQVTLTAGPQFVTVAQGGPAFTVQPGQTFDVAAVEVTP